MYRFAFAIDRNSHRHIFHFEFVDGFHTQVIKADNFRAFNRLRHQISGATNGHQVNSFIVFNRFDRDWTTFGFTDHAQQTGFFQNGTGELIHTGCCSRASRTNNLFAHRINRAHVVDKATLQINRQFFTFGDHVYHALVRSITASEHFARQQYGFTRLPLFHIFWSDGVEVDATNAVTDFPADFWPVFQFRRLQRSRARTVQFKMGVTGRCTVRNDSHWFIRSVRWVVSYFDVEHSGQTAEALSANTQLVHFLIQFKTQLFRTGLGTALLQFLNVYRLKQGFFRNLHRFLCSTANTNPQHTRWAPTCAHLRHLLQHPVNNRVRGVEHGKLRLRFRTTTFRSHVHIHGVTRY